MKIAVLLTGFTRTHRLCYESLSNIILNNYNCDIYCCTWDKQEDGRATDLNDFSIYKKELKRITLCSEEDFIQEEPNIKILNRPGDVFLINERAKEHGKYWVDRLQKQWYIVKRCFSSLHKPQQYDIIVRIRFDISLNKLQFKINNSLNIPRDIGGWSYTDHMAYGNFPIMEKYCNLVNNISSMYINNNVDITHAVDMPKFFMESVHPTSTSYIDDSISYSIVK